MKTFSTWTCIALFVTALSLSACGKKAALDTPPKKKDKKETSLILTDKTVDIA